MFNSIGGIFAISRQLNNIRNRLILTENGLASEISRRKGMLPEILHSLPVPFLSPLLAYKVFTGLANIKELEDPQSSFRLDLAADTFALVLVTDEARQAILSDSIPMPARSYLGYQLTRTKTELAAAGKRAYANGDSNIIQFSDARAASHIEFYDSALAFLNKQRT